MQSTTRLFLSLTDGIRGGHRTMYLREGDDVVSRSCPQSTTRAGAADKVFINRAEANVIIFSVAVEIYFSELAETLTTIVSTGFENKLRETPLRYNDYTPKVPNIVGSKDRRRMKYSCTVSKVFRRYRKIMINTNAEQRHTRLNNRIFRFIELLCFVLCWP